MLWRVNVKRFLYLPNGVRRTIVSALAIGTTGNNRTNPQQVPLGQGSCVRPCPHDASRYAKRRVADENKKIKHRHATPFGILPSTFGIQNDTRIVQCLCNN